MHALFLVLLIGVASNLDNLGVGVAYGLRGIKVPPLSGLIIAAFAFLFTYLSVAAGSYLSHFLSDTTANVMGAILLIGVGIWIVLMQWRERRSQRQEAASPIVRVLHEPEQADADRSGVISLPEALVLGVALSINNLSNGFSAGLWHLSAMPTAISSALFSYVTVWGGAVLSRRYTPKALGSSATFVAGGLLILIGFRQLL